VIVLIVSSLNFMQSGRIEDSIKWNNHTYKVLGEIEKIESSIVNQETGLRGYLVSAKENFLEPYKAGAAGLTAALDSVQTLTSDNATQQERIGRLRLAIDDWHTKISEKEIALMGSPLTMEQARALESSGAGKALMDNIRGVIGELYDAEASLLTVRSQQAEDAMAATEATLIIGGLVTLLATLGIAIFIARTIARPIRTITDVMKELADGRNTNSRIV